MTTLNPREEIIALLRGYFACPVISSLGKLGLIDIMLQGEFTTADMPPNVNREILVGVLRYLETLDLIGTTENGRRTAFRVTVLGEKVLKRYGSFLLLHSYMPYMEEIGNLLTAPPGMDLPEVDRGENILASGQIHSRKFFPPAIEHLRTRNVETIVDLGCGDGQFLESVIEAFPEVRVFGVDLAQRCVDVTRDHLKYQFSGVEVTTVKSDAMDVDKWSAILHQRPVNGTIVISMWFLIHEISRNDPDVVVNFLEHVHKACPAADVLIGEVTCIPSSILKENRYGSIMPELLFFHNLSHQGVLPWSVYQDVRMRIPYDVVAEKQFDVVSGTNGEEIPSSFIWHLQPK